MVADTGAGGVATLSNGGIFQLTAPENTPFNYTVFQRLLRTPRYAGGNTEAAKELFYQITHYSVDGANNSTKSGQEVAGLMADRTVVLLTNPTLNVTGQTVLSCRFDRSIPDAAVREDGSGRWIYSKGAIFEVWLA